MKLAGCRKMNSSKVKIFIISPTESEMTKRATRHPTFASILSKYGYEVEYLTTDYYHGGLRKFTSEEKKEFISKASYKVKIISTIPYPRHICIQRLLGNIKASFLMAIHLLRKSRRNDIIIVPSRPPEFVLIAALLKKLKGAKIVLDIRDIWPDGLPLNNTLSHRLFAKYCTTICNLAAGHGDYYMYAVPGFLEWANRHSKHGNVDFVPLGYDKNRWEECRPLCKQNMDSIVNLAYVGRLTKAMNIQPLIQALARQSRYSLTLIGGGENMTEIKDLTKKLNAKNIHFEGLVSKERIVAEMQNIHISVIPMTVKYAMPNRFFDAIASFRPIMVFGENDAAEFVRNNDIGWSLPFDVQQTITFLETLDKNEIVAKSQNIAKIRNRFSKDFLYEKAIRKIVEST